VWTKRIFLISFILFSVIMVGQARADIFNPASETREIFSLNGNWSFTTEDAPEFSAADFDNSGWETEKVPGTPSGLTPGVARSVWYRRTFQLPEGHFYGWVKLEQVRDEAEVWINGEKLTNPEYQPPLEDRQAGVYQGKWEFDWPGEFWTGDSLRPGEKNVIAIRVSSTGVRPERIPSIPGDVFLIGHPDLYLRSMERLPSAELGAGGVMDHSFYAIVGSQLTFSIDCNLDFYIENEVGKNLHEEKITKTISPGGSIIEFKWSEKPRFEKYTAHVMLENPMGGSDSIGLEFHGTKVYAGRKTLTVNGENYMVKGIEEVSGQTNVAGSDSQADAGAMRLEMRELNRIGANTIRTDSPSLTLMEEALRTGLMVIPVLSDDWERTLIALREYPNVLYWDIMAQSIREAVQAADAISALDPYDRPIGFSGNLEGDPYVRGLRHISIRNLDAGSTDKSICETGNPEVRTGLPVVIVGWGGDLAGVSNPGEILSSWPGLRETWKDCVLHDMARGAVYKGSYQNAPGEPVPGKPGDREWHPLKEEFISNLFSDFEVRILKDQLGGQSAEFRLTAPFVGFDLEVFRMEGNAATRTQRSGIIERRQYFTVPLKDTAGHENLIIRYSTHGGMPHELLFDPAEPVLSPDLISFESALIRMKPGEKKTVKVTLVGTAEAGKADVKVVADSVAIQVEPASRGVHLPARENVDVPFTITATGKGGGALLTAVAYPTGKSILPYKSYAYVDLE